MTAPSENITLGVGNMMKIVAVVPAYNEEQNVAGVVQEVKKYVDEVIVVDDGSSDLTCDRAKLSGADFVLRHLVNSGKGLAMRTGFEAALKRKADAVVFIDADHQHDPRDIKKLVKKLNEEGFDLVTGARQFNKNMPWVFRLGNTFLVSAFNFLFKSKISDLTNGYRVIRAEVYDKVQWRSPRYSVETEMLARAARNKLRIGELKIQTKYLEKYKGTTIFDGIKMFLNMLVWRVRRG